MLRNCSKNSVASWARGFAALCAALALATGGASAAPTETVLHSFTGGSDGGVPVAGLIADSNGNLYGTTGSGGASNAGVVFKLSPSGTETVLHSFGPSDGHSPTAGLIADSNGNLYDTTQSGGASIMARCSSSRRAGPRRCSTHLRAAATGVFPPPA